MDAGSAGNLRLCDDHPALLNKPGDLPVFLTVIEAELGGRALLVEEPTVEGRPGVRERPSGRAALQGRVIRKNQWGVSPVVDRSLTLGDCT